MAASSELPYEVQRREARRRAVIKTKSGLSPIQYLTPNFLSHFPVVMEPKESEEHPLPTWNKVGGLFRRCDAIPATFIDQGILVHEVEMDVFGSSTIEFAECRALALFKLVTQEGERYALTVIYIPFHQRRLLMKHALETVFSRAGNSVALVGMPKALKQCAYMPEPANGEHYTLLPVSGDADTASGSVSDFAAALLTKGSAHYRVKGQVVVKLPGSFTQDTTTKGLIDEEVYARGPVWINKELVEVNNDEMGTPIIIDDRTLAIEREIFVSNFDVYTDTRAFHPLTLVACKPEYEPDYNEFDEAIPDMRARVEKEMEEEREAQRQERICLMQGGEGKT